MVGILLVDLVVLPGSEDDAQAAVERAGQMIRHRVDGHVAVGDARAVLLPLSLRQLGDALEAALPFAAEAEK